MLYRAKTLIAAAACLLAGVLSASAAQLDPVITNTSTGSINVSWTAGTQPFTAAISTSPNLSAPISIGSLSSNSTGYPSLNPDTTYYFRLTSGVDISSTISATTWPVPPDGIFSVPSFFTSASSFTATASIGWSVNNNPEWTRYDLQYADNAGFTPSTVSLKGYPPVILGGLGANTTYYFRVRARGLNGAVTAYTPSISTATLALNLSGLTEAVYETSATVSWSPVNGGTQAQQSEGYRLILSTSELLSPLVIDWTTAAAATASTLLNAPLSANTTYYYSANTLNWYGAADLTVKRSFTTLAPQPQNLARIAVSSFSATLGWTALADGEALGYRLEASSTGFIGGAVSSAATNSMAQNLLTLTGIEANTTYYFRAASLNSAAAPNYTPQLSSITLATPPSANLTTIIPETETITVFIYPLPAAPQRSTCEGYRLEASSTAFGGTGVLLSSATADPQAGSLAITGLRSNTLYNLRLATLNWSGGRNYSTLEQTATLRPPAPAGPQLAGIWESSATVYFHGVAGGDSYMVEASTYQFFDYIHRSSATADVAVTTLTIINLDENTRYYFRAGALYNGSTAYANTTPDTRPTLALPLALDIPPFAGVFYSSVTVSWTALDSSPQEATAQAYLLEAATTQAFTQVLFSSHSANITANRLSLTGLAPNTSYYFRAGTLNEDSTANYTHTPATATLANQPLPQAFGLTPFAITLNWQANSNPPDTAYLVEMDDDAGFGSMLPSSSTALSSATFSGLLTNTTYYSRVTAVNRLGRLAPTVDFSPMATSAHHPATAGAHAVYVTSITANWGPGANIGGTNYQVQTSSSSDFSGLVLSSVTTALSADFTGLVSNASYYLRVSALNLSGVPTAPAVPLSVALTLPTTAFILPVQQTYSGMLIDGFSVNWRDNNNSAATVYRVDVSTASDFSVLADSKAVQALTCAFGDLLIDTTYWARVQARGQTGLLSGFENAGSTRTLLSANLNALALKDSIVTLETSYGQISVHLPQGSIGSSTILTLRPSTAAFAAPLSAVSELAPTGIGVSIVHFPPTLVLRAITITIPYRLSDLPPGTNRSRLILALYDETNAIWIPLPSVSETARNRVIGQTWHLSTFQIMQATPEAGLSNVKIYPNPYRPNSVSDVMHFTNMTPYARVKLYTFLGELVREVKADVNGMAHWDGLNKDGRKAASGVYIAFIQTQDKKTSKSFKVALER